MNDFYYGAHVSIKNGIISAIDEIIEYQGNMIQIFISNPVSVKNNLKYTDIDCKKILDHTKCTYGEKCGFNFDKNKSKSTYTAVPTSLFISKSLISNYNAFYSSNNKSFINTSSSVKPNGEAIYLDSASQLHIVNNRLLLENILCLYL